MDWKYLRNFFKGQIVEDGRLGQRVSEISGLVRWSAASEGSIGSIQVYLILYLFICFVFQVPTGSFA